MNDLRALLSQFERDGLSVTRKRGSRHWKIRDGDAVIAVAHCTPGGGRGLANLRAEVKRALRARHPERYR